MSDKFESLDANEKAAVESTQYRCRALVGRRLSKKLHSLRASIRRIIQTKGHSCARTPRSRRRGTSTMDAFGSLPLTNIRVQDFLRPTRGK
jgi:hypothetical protein